MEVKGMQHIAAPREAVWRVLNDTELLIGCIDGCERLERASPERINAAIKVNLGLFSLRFHGALVLSNMRPPYSYTIAGEGRGAMSGLATGETDVRLEEVAGKGTGGGVRGEGGAEGTGADEAGRAGQSESGAGGGQSEGGAEGAGADGAGRAGQGGGECSVDEAGRAGQGESGVDVGKKMETELHYHMRGAAEGKIAKLGSKLLSKTAAKIAARFFERVAEKAQKLAG